MPIMATASTSAATMNIFTCSIGVELGLARRAFEKAAAENSEADGGAERAQTEDDSDGKYGHGLDVCEIIHSILLNETNAELMQLSDSRHQWCSCAIARYTIVNTMNMKACSVITSR